MNDTFIHLLALTVTALTCVLPSVAALILTARRLRRLSGQPVRTGHELLIALALVLTAAAAYYTAFVLPDAGTAVIIICSFVIFLPAVSALILHLSGFIHRSLHKEKPAAPDRRSGLPPAGHL